MSPPPKKPRLLTDFFAPSDNPPKKPCPAPASLEPSTCLEPRIPGLSLYLNFITPSEETQLLSFLHSPTRSWRSDLSRRTMHFGGSYCLLPPRGTAPPPHPQIIQAPPMPSAFSFLLVRMHAQSIYAPSRTPQYCIVNHYTGTQGISAHTENFSFASPVVGLSLLEACPMRFHELVEPDGGSVRSGKAQKARRTGRWVDVVLPGRSLVVMDGEARWKWQHEIVRGRKGRGEGWERVSLTFRYKPGE